MFLDVFDKLLKENNLNRRQFALKSGIPYTTVDGFYKKGYENIRLTTLRKIADFFNVSLDYLVFGDDVPFGKKNEAMEFYKKLDTNDKAEIRGEMKHMLRADKYTSSKGSYASVAAKGQGTVQKRITDEQHKAAFDALYDIDNNDD